MNLSTYRSFLDKRYNVDYLYSPLVDTVKNCIDQQSSPVKISVIQGLIDEELIDIRRALYWLIIAREVDCDPNSTRHRTYWSTEIDEGKIAIGEDMNEPKELTIKIKPTLLSEQDEKDIELARASYYESLAALRSLSIASRINRNKKGFYISMSEDCSSFSMVFKPETTTNKNKRTIEYLLDMIQTWQGEREND